MLKCNQLSLIELIYFYNMKVNKQPLKVILTDTHLSEANAAINASIFQQAIDYTKSIGLCEIDHLGDIFESRKGQSQTVLDAFTQVLDNLAAHDICLNLIPGNHDKQNYASQVSYLTPYREHPALNLWETPALTGIRGGAIEFYYLPFFSDDKYIETFPINYKKDRGTILVGLTHIGMDGAVMNNGSKVASRINSELFDKFDKVLIGHYHDASSYSDKIKYIGASFQHNHGETPNKGLTVLYDDLSIETVKLQFPQYITYEVNASEIKIHDLDALEKERETTQDFIRITLTGEEKDIKTFDANRLKAIGFDVQKKQDAISAEVIEQRTVAHSVLTISQTFEQFCSEKKLDYFQGATYLNKTLGLAPPIMNTNWYYHAESDCYVTLTEQQAQERFADDLYEVCSVSILVATEEDARLFHESLQTPTNVHTS